MNNDTAYGFFFLFPQFFVLSLISLLLLAAVVFVVIFPLFHCLYSFLEFL